MGAKWISTYGNAMSIVENNPAMYGKDITLRYPVMMQVDGSKIKVSFDNYTGLEAVTISQASIAFATSDRDMELASLKALTFSGQKEVIIPAGKQVTSDVIDFKVIKGQKIMVNLYFADYTQLRSGVIASGKLCDGFFAYGNQCENAVIHQDNIKHISWYYFLNQIDVYSEKAHHGIMCYGDSITSQSWPDDLEAMILKTNLNDAIIRRAASGTRILRQYENITYQHYGLSAINRATHEMQGEGIKWIIILQGINDIIHPVGIEVNRYRPWSDLPTLQELIDGLQYLINKAEKAGYQVILGTLTPIEGWRTYAPFREELRQGYNDWIRNNKGVAGIIDFDKAVRNPSHHSAFLKKYNSGDSLHPSEAGYQAMAEAALKVIEELEGDND